MIVIAWHTPACPNFKLKTQPRLSPVSLSFHVQSTGNQIVQIVQTIQTVQTVQIAQTVQRVQTVDTNKYYCANLRKLQFGET
jgi:hypothetical protein